MTDSPPTSTSATTQAPRAVTRRVAATLAVLGVAAIVGAGALAFVYQPLVPGSATSADSHLLISATETDLGNGEQVPLYTYRYQTDTSYYTLFSMRNEGPLAVTVLGLDTSKVAALIPFVGPVELRLGSTNEGHGMTEWASAPTLHAAAVEPGAELWLWVRWDIGTCDANGMLPLAPGTGIGPPTWIPLRWSVLGIPRTTNVDLNYQVMFQLPQGDPRACSTASAIREATH